MESIAPSAIPQALPLDSEVAHGRYRLERVIGEGGMAVVHEALDLVHGRRVALKRLRCDNPQKRAAFTALFEQEFLALSELAHPRIVAVYDYGVDAHGPYYTMELLDGGDLRRLAPADYRTACALARDVCSALSLVHSRRQVFRDLSPSNVRRTSDGLAKLIDFGGLTAMGPCKDMVGTLPCVPPEALDQQPLDARTDLYALGATLYFTLVRRHAYPARDIPELGRLWEQPIKPPSELVPGIPRALDRLVLDLLQLDPALRPASAAEVMERLSAIAQLPHDESLLVEQAYLATPALVAREGEMALLREHSARAKQGQGASLLIGGVSGVGRSRLLDCAALEAKLAGMLVLRADAQQDLSDYGAIHTLARSLLRQAPQLAQALAEPHLSLLASVVPELMPLRESQVMVSGADSRDLQRRLQGALRAWLCAVARERPLLIAIDDVDRIDAASAACFALLARDTPQHPLLLVCSRTSGATIKHQALQGALHILARASQQLKLTPLSLELSELLLGSVFGEVPHLAQTTHHIQRITGGIPRDIIRLARHLVSEGLVRYEAGAWLLPQRLSATDLPASMADALELRVGRLSPEARTLVYALSREPSFSFALESCAELCELLPARAGRCLEELLGEELVSRVEAQYRATQSALSTPLEGVVAAADRARVHTRLAQLCEQRGDMPRVAKHLMHAGEPSRATSLLVKHAVESVARTNHDTHAFQALLNALPENWLETYEEALAICQREKRPALERRALLRRLSGLLAHSGDVDGLRHLQKLLEDLAHDAGLDLLGQLPAEMDPVTRVKTAMAQAAARTLAAPESERGSMPPAALGELASQTAAAMGVLAFSNNYAAWQAVPKLDALSLLSPSLSLVALLTECVGMRIGGRSEAALGVYQKLLDRLDQPDRAGLDASYHLHTYTRIMGAMGTLEAAMGRRTSLAWAERVAKEPAYEATSLAVEQLFQLFQGNVREARRVEQRIELLRLHTGNVQVSEAHFEFHVLCANALANDMTGVKRSTDGLTARAKQYDSFKAAHSYGRGEYQRIRGDHAAALVELEDALRLMHPGEHVLWAFAGAAHVRTLIELGRLEEAREAGERYLAQSADLGYLQNPLRVALSRAHARMGDHASALALNDLAIEQLTALGVTGLNLAIAYEARAQLATLMDDDAGFRRYAGLYAELWPAGNRSLRGSLPTAQQSAEAAHDEEQDELDALSQFRSSIESCQTFFERARTGLEFIGRRAGALGGVLFTRTAEGLVRTASFGEVAKDHALDVWATEFFKREVTEHVTEDVDPREMPALAPRTAPDVPPCTPVLLAHDDAKGYAFTGVALFIGQDGRLKRHSTRLVAELSRSVVQMDRVSPEYL